MTREVEATFHTGSGMLVSASWANGGPVQEYEYGASGKLWQVRDATGNILLDFDYDTAGRLVETTRGAGETFQLISRQTYIDTAGSGGIAGNTHMVSQCFVDASDYQATVYTFDTSNRVIQKKEWHDLQNIGVTSAELPEFTGTSSITNTEYRENTSLGVSNGFYTIETVQPTGTYAEYQVLDTNYNPIRTFRAAPGLTTVSGATLVAERRYQYSQYAGLWQRTHEIDVCRDNATAVTTYDSSTGLITGYTTPVISAANSGSGAAIPGFSQTYTYDPTNGKRVLTETRLDGSGNNIEVTNTYDDYDNPASRTEVGTCDTHVTFTEYNAFGKLTKQTDADGFVTRSVYSDPNHPNNGSGLLLARYVYESGDSGPVLQETRYFYYSTGSHQGRLQRVEIADHLGPFTLSNPDGWQQTEFYYDDYGRVIEKVTTHTVKPGTYTWTYAYDTQDRLCQVTFPDDGLGGGSRTWIRLGYDGRGLLVDELLGYGGTLAEGTGGTTVLANTYAYDANGNLSERLNQTAADKPDRSTFGYDGVGRRTQQKDHDDGTVGYDIITRFEYYNNGLDMNREYVLEGEAGPIRLDARGEFDEAGRRWKETVLRDPSAGPNPTADYLTTRTFDIRGNEIEVRVTDTVHGDAVMEYEYTCFNHRSATITSLTATTTSVATRETDKRGNTTSERDALGHLTTYDVNALSLPTEDRCYERIGGSDVLVFRSETKWTSRGQRGHEVRLDAQGVAVDQQRWEYDALGLQGRSARLADPSNTGPVSTTTDLVEDASYDGLGRLVSSTRYDGGNALTVLWGYDEIGRRETATYPVQGNQDILAYHAGTARIRTRTASDEAGPTITTTLYDPFGRMRQKTIEAIPPATAITTATSLDAIGRPVRETDALGYVTVREFDGIGQLESVTEDLGGITERTTEFAHTQKGDLLTVTALEGEEQQTTAYTHDLAGRRIRIDHPADATTPASHIEFEYDPEGRTETRTAEDGFVTHFTRNWRGQVLEKRHNDSVGPILESFAYDALGRLLVAAVGDLSSSSYKTSFLYGDGSDVDGDGLSDPAYTDAPVSVQQVVNGTAKEIAYQYGTTARRSSITYPSGCDTVITYGRDGLGNVVSIDRNGARCVNYVYTGRKVSSRQVRTVAGPGEVWIETQWTRPDQLRRPASISNLVRSGSTDGIGGVTTDLIGLTSTFDAASNLDTQTTLNSPVENGLLDYTYDGLHRLTHIDYPDTTSEDWILDSRGSWNTYTARDNAVTTYEDNVLNQYTLVSGQMSAPMHEARGNLIRNERSYGFSYDFENRLTRVFTDDSPANGQYDSGEAVHAEYVVDALGRRVQVSKDGQTTYRFYDTNDVVLAEFALVDTATPTLVHVNGPTYLDEKILTTTTDGSEYYYLLGHLYSVAAVVDEHGEYVQAISYSGYGLPTITELGGGSIAYTHDADGDGDIDNLDIVDCLDCYGSTEASCLARHDFDANGVSDGVVDSEDMEGLVQCLLGPGVAPESAACETTLPAPIGRSPFAYAGQRLDVLNGGDLLLYDCKARVYDPLHGRFQQRDPAEFVDSYNLYEYALSRPTTVTDPTGQFTFLGLNVTTALRYSLSALNLYGNYSLARDVVTQLKAGVGIREVIFGLAVDAAIDRLGGKLFDAASDLLGTLTRRFRKTISRLCCFVEGTPVDTPDGPVPIECLQPGDMVITRDAMKPGSAPTVRPVKRVFTRVAPLILWITLANGEAIGTTPGHVIWSNEQGWVHAAELSVNDSLLLIDGSQASVLDITLEVGGRDTYNLDVAGTDTYYADSVWVHNTSCRRRLFDKHHIFPKFLGGDPGGALVGLPPDLHRPFHSDLLAALRKRGLKKPHPGRCDQWAKLISREDNSSKMVEALFEVAEKYDGIMGGDVLSTALLDQMAKDLVKY